jgi:hypothetical protein
MATSKAADRDSGSTVDRGSGKEGYDASLKGVEDFQDGRSLEDPDIGPDDNIVPSPWSSQQLAERTEQGEGEQIREELAKEAEALKDNRGGEQRTEPVRPGDDR